jgi:hypothetical protein
MSAATTTGADSSAPVFALTHHYLRALYLVTDTNSAGRLVEPFNLRLGGYGFHPLYAESEKKRSAFLLFRQWLLDEVELFRQHQAASQDKFYAE